MKRFIKNFAIYLVIFAVVLGVAFFYKGADGAKKTAEVKFSTFATHLEKGKSKTKNITDRKMTATLKNGNKEYAYAPSVVEISWLENSYVFPQVKSGKLKLSSDPPQSSVNFFSLLPTIIMVVALGFLFYFMMSQGGNNKAFQFGKNRAKLYKENGKNIRFADVAGLKEEKEELEEIVDFLKNPSKYSNLGARIPKGVLLVGNPGTGKTYISRATAGEAGVPFLTNSGSDFVEMKLAVAASRVRDLFDQAKKNAPCIIFIDEIDAVGRKRGAGLGGGNDEREQTLNQLLVEMDGFDGNSGIIILAATNRPDVLDPALLRPGRFDRQIVIGMPDVKAREEIFKVHTKNKPLADDVTIEILARRTPGFSPADIENLVNEAALLTARRNGTKIRMDEIEEATTKVMAGPAKKSRVISEAERKLTAYHEAGHAIVMKAIPNSDPVHQITIIPRGMAGGFTMSLPEDEKFFMTKGDMVNMIKHLLGGRVAEELKLDDISNGASNDLERATAIARQMITKYGFSSKLGPVSFSSSDEVFLGKDFSTRQNYSEETASEIDAEIKHILESCYEATTNILKDNDEAFERVAQALLLIETLDGEQFNDLYEGKITPEELAENVKARDEEIAELNKAEAKESERLEEERRQEAEERLKELQSVIVGDLKFEDSTFAEENKHTDKKDSEKPSEEEKAKSSVGWPSDTKEEPQDDEIDVDADTDADAAKDAEPESKDESKNDAEADKE